MPKTKKPSRSKLIKKLDNVFSQYIRLSRSDDQGFCTCVTCGKSAHWKEGGIQAGHFISRKHYSVRWDEDNVHPQCVGCNVFKAGEQYKYSIFLGEKLSEYLYNKSLKITKFTSIEIEDLIEKYSLKLRNHY